MAILSAVAPLANRPKQGTALHYKNFPDEETVRPTKPKRTKLKPSKRKQRQRFVQIPKQLSSEAELARHVQTVFSGEDLEELMVDSAYGVDQTEECSEDVTKKLTRHPALVLNADYQVSLMFL